MKLKKRSKRSRLRGSRTCRHGSRKKRRGKGSYGGKGLGGTGKRAGQRITYILKYFKSYLGKKGFTSHKKVEQRKLSVKNIGSINIKRYMQNDVLMLNTIKLVGSKDDVAPKLKSSGVNKIMCFDISKKLKHELEKNNIQVETEMTKKDIINNNNNNNKDNDNGKNGIKKASNRKIDR